MKVLLVDDSKTMLKINENICRGLKVDHILTAGNGLEAVKIVQDNSDIDLVLLDINMPIMGGYEALEKIKTINPNIKVFMCTTEGGKDEVIRALKLGANNYIIKPIKREVLEEKIKLVKPI